MRLYPRYYNETQKSIVTGPPVSHVVQKHVKTYKIMTLKGPYTNGLIFKYLVKHLSYRLNNNTYKRNTRS